MINAELGAALRAQRKRARLTQTEAARLIDCDSRTIQRYEAGERTPDMFTALRMANAYGCTLSELYPKSL